MKKKSYLNLIRELALTDFKLKYQGSFFGYIWSLVKPLALFAVMYVVFSKFLRIGGNIPNFPVYLLFGIVLWSFFTETTSLCLSSIVDSRDLIKKVYFPRIILIIAASISSLITFILNLAVVFIFMAIRKINISWDAIYFILIIIELYILTIGLSLFLSALYVKFRDLKHIWDISLQILFYGSPIIYPLDIVPVKFSKIIMLNPIAQVIQDSREILITRQTMVVADVLSSPYKFIPYILPFIIFLLGYSIFQKMAAKFAEEA